MRKKIVISTIFFFFTFFYLYSAKLIYFKVKTTYKLPSSDKKVTLLWNFFVENYDIKSGLYTFKIEPEVRYKNVYGEIKYNIKNGKLYEIRVWKKNGGKFKLYEKKFAGGTTFFIDTYGGVPVFVIPHTFNNKSGKIEIKKNILLDKNTRFLRIYEIKNEKSEIVVSDLNHKIKLATFKFGNFFWWKESQIYNIKSRVVEIKYEK